jgi:thioesterase domain-containing protein
MFMLLVAAYHVLLHKIAGANDVAVLFNASNRQRPETQGLIGMFTNLLILRSDLSGNPTFRELLEQVRQRALEAIDHQELPCEVLLGELRPDDDLSRFRWVNVHFGYHQRISSVAPRGRSGIEIALRPGPVPELETRYIFCLELSELAEGLHGEIDYDSSLFDESTVARWESQYIRLLDEILANPDQRLSGLSQSLDGEVQSELSDPSGGAASGSARHARDEATAESGPDPASESQFAASLWKPVSNGSRSLVLLRNGNSMTPLYCLPGLGGHVAVFRPLAEALAQSRPVYGLQALGLDAGQAPQESIEAMAAHYIRELRTVQPHGPYLLSGWSLGGLTALEAARQLAAGGEAVDLVALLDTYLSAAEFEQRPPDQSAALRWLAPRLNLSVAELMHLPLDQQWERIAEQARSAHGIDAPEIQRLAAVCQAHLAAAGRYQPQPCPCAAVLFRAGVHLGVPSRRWQSLLPGLTIESVPGDHYSMLQPPQVAVLAERLDAYLSGHMARVS